MDDEARSGAQNQIDGLARLIDRMIPKSAGRVSDIYGVVYQLPGALSARQQTKVLRVLSSVMDVDEIRNGMATVQASAKDGNVASVIKHVVDLASNDAILNALDEAFSIAFPGLLAQHADIRPTDHPTDLFALEEVVGALLPFFARSVQRLMGEEPATTTAKD